jgi:hypothetical protein
MSGREEIVKFSITASQVVEERNEVSDIMRKVYKQACLLYYYSFPYKRPEILS